MGENNMDTKTSTFSGYPFLGEICVATQPLPYQGIRNREKIICLHDSCSPQRGSQYGNV